jgi:cytochrome c2
VYKTAGYKCEICGGQGRRHPVECHEVWHYDDKARVQKLERMIALCPACHEVKHIGLAEVRGRAQEAMKHLAKVNGWTFPQAMRYVSWAFEVWQHRSRFQWKLDLSHLASHGVRIDNIKPQQGRPEA